MKEKIYAVLGHLVGLLIVLVIAAALIIPKVITWKECRKDHSFIYCVHLIG